MAPCDAMDRIRELEARVRELTQIVSQLTPAIRDVLWCALVWNDHNHDYEDLTEKVRSAAVSLGFTNEYLGQGVERANRWMERVDAALAAADGQQQQANGGEAEQHACRSCHGQGCEAHECNDGTLVQGGPCNKCQGSGVQP